MHDSLSPVGDPLGWHGSCTELAAGGYIRGGQCVGAGGWGEQAPYYQGLALGGKGGGTELN